MKKYLLFACVMVPAICGFSQSGGQEHPEDSGFQPGHYSILQMDYNLTAGYGSESFARLSMIHGHRFSELFSAGIGTGFKYKWHGRFVSIPFFLDFRGNFNGKRISPYWAMGIGYSFDASNKMRGEGLFVNPQLGISFKMFGKSSLNIGLGYDFMRARQYTNMPSYPVPDQSWSGTKNIQSMTINLGISF